MSATKEKVMNKVVHFEIPVDDMAKAKDFYSIFGWELSDMPDGDYACVRTVPADENLIPKEPGAINGGMLKRTDKIKSPLVAIEVSSIESYVEKVLEKGGSLVMEKFQVGDLGYYAYVTDCEDNVLGLWQPL